MNEAFVSLLPFLFVTLIFFLFSIPICRRKGKSFAFSLLCLIPFVTIFVLLYLVSLTDKQVLDRLAALEGKPSR
ncbi:MAG TPA: hypothetical protein VJL90_01110 [Pseudorhodoplanes sp.]|nr:hypothetical protein [Pseudorhodoplanes sp.]